MAGRKPVISRDRAVELAQEALIWLSCDPDRIGPFLALSGIAPDELRARAGDPEFLAAVLDHLLGSDAWVEAFAAEHRISPHRPAEARAALPGGDAPAWT